MKMELNNNLKHWWVFLLRGLLFILLGVYMIGSPSQSYMALSLLFGIIIFFAGVAELAHALTNRHSQRWNWRLLVGILDLILGLILIFNIKVSMAVLPFIIGIWFLITGISLLSFATMVRRPFWLVLGGLLTTFFSFLVMFLPNFGAITIVLWTALAFIVAGSFNCLLAFRLKNVNDYFDKNIGID